MGIWAHGSFLRKCRQKSAGRLHFASLLEYNKKQLFALFFARTATSMAVMIAPARPPAVMEEDGTGQAGRTNPLTVNPPTGHTWLR